MSFEITAQYEANEFEKIQYEAARTVLGATKLVSINALLEEVDWETLLQEEQTQVNLIL